MKLTFLILSALITVASIGQTIVSGKVTDKKGAPIVGVNIFFKNTYDGGISDLNGAFSVSTTLSDSVIIVARFVGYQTYECKLKPGEQQIKIVLKESTESIDAVTVTAGSFTAGDKHKGALMKTLDIYTTAGSLGDVTGALITLPGTQQANDDGRLLVRGGEAYETKTVIDGVLAGKPYYSKVPDAPTRGRFSPSLFSGVMFNTGGYSAEYGQALSSVLVLESNDLFTDDVLSLSLMSIGAEGNYTECWENNSISISGGYTNLAPYYGLINNELDWEKPTESVNGSIAYRHKTKKNGMFKAYFTGDGGIARFKQRIGVGNMAYTTESINKNFYGNVSYRQPLTQKTSIKAGASATIDSPDINYSSQQIKTNEKDIEARVMLIHDIADGLKLRYGINNTFTNYAQTYQAHPDSIVYKPEFTDYLTGVFAEAQVQISKNLAFSSGIRYEYSSLLNKNSVAPRLGLAMATGKKSQVSASFGHFYQNPHSDELKFSSNLNFERADHYILGYQTGSTDQRFLRLETYYKKYSQLVKYVGNAFYMPDNYNNSGEGEALGFDLFWRDNKSIKYFEYWLSYSFIDTQRKYKGFDKKVQPSFISQHNLSLVGKYWIAPINCQIGGTFWVASGRNWYESTPDGRITHNGNITNALNMNLSYITHMFSNETIIHLSLSNALGNKNVYGYREGPIRNSDGKSIYLPITNDVKQFAFIGIFITLK